MNVSNVGTYLKAVITVTVEGYFVERFINLCKINNIELWNIKYITQGKISFEMPAKKYASIKKYIKKTKCKCKVVMKKGIYFDIFKYRKRRLAIYISTTLIVVLIILSTFIWKINITGNTNIKSEEIIDVLRRSKITKGTNKLYISKSKISDLLRAENYNIAWAGVEINGINLVIKIAEKQIGEVKDNTLGNIIALKSRTYYKNNSNRRYSKGKDRKFCNKKYGAY